MAVDFLSTAKVEAITGKKYDYKKLYKWSNNNKCMFYDGDEGKDKLFHASAWASVYNINIRGL